MTTLPPTLRPWADSLALLDAELAVALGPVVLRLEQLMGRLDAPGTDHGEPDGYDGTTHRGTPDRLLVEEWLLADEVPLEFLRRAAEGEQRFLRPAVREPERRGRVVAVVDSGPEQLGAGRLVQLAALVVLDRRARAAGSELLVVDARSGASLEGTLDVVLPRWLTWRTLAAADPEVVAGRVADHDDDDAVWVLAGPALAAGLAGPTAHPRVLVSQVGGFGAAGVATVRVRVGGAAAVVLDLPDSRAAVRALRGEGLVRRAPRAAPAAGVAETEIDASGAAFCSSSRMLLWRGPQRGEPTGELVRLPIGPEVQGKVRRHLVPGTVVAAAHLGRRTVVLLERDGLLTVSTIGKAIAWTDHIGVPMAAVGLSHDDVHGPDAGPLGPLFLRGDRVMVQLIGVWWELGRHGAVERADVVAVAPGPNIDAPRVVAHDSQLILLGPDGWEARHQGAGAWVAFPGTSHGRWHDLAVPPHHQVHGLVVVGGVPRLVVQQPGQGAVVVGEHETTPLASAPAGALVSVHPTLPWLAVTTQDAIRVVDLDGQRELARVRITG